MYKITKYVRQINLLTSNILKKHELFIKNQPLLYLSSSNSMNKLFFIILY